MPSTSTLLPVEKFRFELPGRLEYRDAARAFLAYVCECLARRGQLPNDAGHRIISAFVEAFNNSVIHAYEGLPVGQVEVEMEIDSERLLVRIIDRGHAFKPEQVPEPDLEALPTGGLGLFIIRNFMDQVHFERVEDKNVLTMEKQINGVDTTE